MATNSVHEFQFLLTLTNICLKFFYNTTLICISLIISDDEHIFIYLLTFTMSSLSLAYFYIQLLVFKSLACFYIQLLVLFLLNCLSS
jgi:hypothetical protein